MNHPKANVEKEKQPEAPLASIAEVFSFGKGAKKKRLLIVGISCAIVSGCVFPAMAFVYSNSLKSLGASTNGGDFLKNVRRIAYSMMCLGVIAFTSMSIQAACLETVAGEMALDLKTSWFRALLRQDLAYYDINDVSGTATMISTNSTKYKKGVGRKLAEGVQFAVSFLGGLAYAFYSSWEASLVILSVVPFMTLSILFLVKITQSQTARSNESYSEAGSIVYTAVASIRTILSLNAVETMIDKFYAATTRAYEGAAGVVHLVGLANGLTMASYMLAYVSVTLFGSWLLYDAVRTSGCDPSGWVENKETCNPSAVNVFGSLMGISIAAAVLPQVAGTIESFTGARTACYSAIVAISRKVGTDAGQECGTAEIHEPEVPLPKYEIDSSSEEGLKPELVRGRIEFNDVTFQYPTRQETKVFNGFSLIVEAGKTVALVGPSGSGKSTAVQLLERFYDPTGGNITLDGNNVRDLNVKWLRQQIGLVGQEPCLFACTIRENIAYGNPDATKEQIEQAARNANAHEFISSFPDGYETNVGDHGAQLSGGQKQRIAIARALVKKPKILLLDEATSALDSDSESVVQEALDRLLQEGTMTTIVIAHRLSTIRNADLIAVVDKGIIVEQGPHDELMAKHGHYWLLVDAQTAKKSESEESNASLSSNPNSSHGNIGDDVHYTEEHIGLDSSDTGVLVRFRNVHFSYPSRPDNKVFRGLNLTVMEGETLALVGPSGHGKSSTVQLMERFYDPSKGTIEICGIDVKEINVKYLRDQIGLVGQEPVLFDATIAENIRFSFPQVTQAQIEDAAKQANAHDFIMQFPDKYNTIVGSGGTLVSGGQKQRIAIARALIKKPRILLLDEATSALDSESENVVQEALDKIMEDKSQTVVVIAHRLSTIRNADRIAVIADGKVLEIGSRDELMSLPGGHYKRLEMLQDLDTDKTRKRESRGLVSNHNNTMLHDSPDSKSERSTKHRLEQKECYDLKKDIDKRNARRAWELATPDRSFFLIGTIGAILAGLIFPGFGFIFAYMIDLLYTPVYPCIDGSALEPPPPPFQTCQEFYDFTSEDMKQLSFKITYGCIGVIVASLIGNILLFYGFGTASERMNKRVRDAAFNALIRQEVGFFDLRPVGVITSQIQDDAALIHSFSGEPIRTLVMNTSSVAVGLVVSFFFMWPFALLTLCILPFMAFGAEMEMKMYMGQPDEVEQKDDENSPGGIVVETLLNMRTVASLTAETGRNAEYECALRKEDPHPFQSNFIKGLSSGLGQFFQMWGVALMIWWGGWLLLKYPSKFEYRDFLISMFSLLLSLNGLAIAAQGATNREKAKAAAGNIFALMDRYSSIDPLGEGGKKDI